MYKKLYEEIWNERKEMDLEGAEYVSCVDCGKRIYESQLAVHHFAHIESKGSTPEKKLDKKNIQIKCFRHHAKERNPGEFKNYLPIA